MVTQRAAPRAALLLLIARAGNDDQACNKCGRVKYRGALRRGLVRHLSAARVNWLLRQIKTESIGEAFVRMTWPGRSETTQFELSELIKDPAICEKDKNGLQVTKFHIFIARRLGATFTQQVNFIKELEEVVPFFYREIGQNLQEWRKPAPKIKADRSAADDVAVDALQDDAEAERKELP